MADSDDLDALLDEAMDLVDEQERTHQEEVKQREAKLEEDLQKALDEQGGGGEEAGADMIKMFQALLGGGKEGAELGDGLNFDTFKDDVAKLISTLENVDDMKDEDKANLNRVKELMTVLENDDEEKAKELLDQMKTDPAMAMPDGDAGSEDVDAAFKNCMDTLQKLSDTSVTADGDAKAVGTPAASSVPPSAAVAAATEGGVPDNIAEMLLTAILDPDFVEPIKVMRDAYEPFLAAKGEALSENERAVYKKQHAKTIEICEFLAVPVRKEDDTRVTRLLELMHEFSELGEPPKELSEYASEKVAGEETEPKATESAE